MGYYTCSYTMVARQFTNQWEAAFWLISGRNEELFEMINTPAEFDNIREKNHQLLTQATWKNILEKEFIDITSADWKIYFEWVDELSYQETYENIEKVFGFNAEEVIRKSGLSFQYEGDARYGISHGWLGLSLDKMGDDETKNQFIGRIQEIMERYSGRSINDLKVINFSYTS